VMSTHDRDTRSGSGLSRRQFVTATAGAAAGFMIVPRHVLGRGLQAPSDTVNVAVVGVGGMGGSNTQALMGQNIVAFCDVDSTYMDAKIKQWRDRAYPPEPTPSGTGRAGGAGANQQPQPEQVFKNFGLSQKQQAANQKWTAPDQTELIKRFIDVQLPKVQKYRDYREMLEKQKDIDGVVVATPDHMHAIIASAAMTLGKHVYVQKPLTWSVHEARHLAKKAKDNPKLVTQMGNQGHSQDEARRGQEYLMAGAIGDVREVHVWTNRPLGYWPQGVPRPAPMSGDPSKLTWNNNGVNTRLAAAMGKFPVPDGLSWDLFLGVAPEVEYHPIYHPFNWRGWVDWGQGALGDMGAHLVDHPVWGLELGLPTSIETIATPFNGATYPNATTTYYEFAARPGKPAVRMIWYDGGLMPPKPDELGTESVDPAGGVLYIGSKGKMVQETYGSKPRLLPAERHNSFGAPPEVLPRIAHQSHEMNWVNGIRGRDQVTSPFSYAAHLNEIMLLGVASLRAKSKLYYDGANMRVTNNAAANEFLTRTYRSGYSL
jgi:predicted dehydrogenase